MNRTGVVWAETGLDTNLTDPIAAWIALPVAQRLYPQYGFWPFHRKNTHRRVWSYSFRYGTYDDDEVARETARKNNKNVRDSDARFDYHFDGGEVILNICLKSGPPGQLSFWKKDNAERVDVETTENDAIVFLGTTRHSVELNTGGTPAGRKGESDWRMNLIIRLSSTIVRRSPAESAFEECIEHDGGREEL